MSDWVVLDNSELQPDNKTIYNMLRLTFTPKAMIPGVLMARNSKGAGNGRG